MTASASAYLVGRITVRDPAKWERYRAAVPATLAPWGGELLFRAHRARELSGTDAHADIVVVRFPDMAALDGWHASAAYQALIPLRQEAAEVVLSSYAG